MRWDYTLPEVSWQWDILLTKRGGSGHTKLPKPEFPSPQNPEEKNLKDETKPTRTDITNQDRNLDSLLWM